MPALAQSPRSRPPCTAPSAPRSPCPPAASSRLPADSPSRASMPPIMPPTECSPGTASPHSPSSASTRTAPRPAACHARSIRNTPSATPAISTHDGIKSIDHQRVATRFIRSSFRSRKSHCFSSCIGRMVTKIFDWRAARSSSTPLSTDEREYASGACLRLPHGAHLLVNPDGISLNPVEHEIAPCPPLTFFAPSVDTAMLCSAAP